MNLSPVLRFYRSGCSWKLKEYNPAGTVTDVSGKFELTFACFDSLCGGEFYRIRGFKSGYIGKDRIYFPPEGRSESVG